MSDDGQSEEETFEVDDKTGALFGEDQSLSSDQAEPYIVLARKYRPKSFQDLIGQEVMVKTLTNAFKMNRIAHAFLLTGVRGIGKTTTARLLARAFNYESDGIDRPSIEFDSPGRHCEAIMAGNHPDILELDAASRSKVDEMRELLDGVRYAPLSARYKVYIIDEVHMLSSHAFNALLKTLEEPPPHAKFILATTELQKVPITIRSRCQRFDLKRFSLEDSVTLLSRVAKQEGTTIEDDAIKLIARAAEGSARDGLSLLDQAIVQRPDNGSALSAETVRSILGLADTANSLEVLKAITEKQSQKALEAATRIYHDGAEPAGILRGLLDNTGELAKADSLKEDYRYFGPPQYGEEIKALAEDITQAQTSRLWTLFLQGLDDLTRAPNTFAALEMTILKAISSLQLPSPEEAAALFKGETNTQSPEKKTSDNSPVTSQTPASQIADQTDYSPDADETRPESFSDLLSLLESHKKISLLSETERAVRPVTMTQNRLDCRLKTGTARDLIIRLADELSVLLGYDFIVNVISDEGKASLDKLPLTKEEERRNYDAARAEKAKETPLVASILDTFPKAKISRVTFAGEQADEATEDNIVAVDFNQPEKDLSDDNFERADSAHEKA